MEIKIALAGNPNCGKTTLFNALTGANQFVGNWPGVTVEKEGRPPQGRKDVIITDLPGIYSLSPTPGGGRRPQCADRPAPGRAAQHHRRNQSGRNLYLTTQLAELGIPMVVALNMMDVVRKTVTASTRRALNHLGVPVVEIPRSRATA